MTAVRERTTWSVGDAIPGDVEQVWDHHGDPWYWAPFTETWLYDCDLHRGCIELETADLLETYGPATRWPLQLDLFAELDAS